MRVQLSPLSFLTSYPRIIPACAGTTFLFLLYRLQLRDHPRVCGYNYMRIIYIKIQIGSSPRVRVQQLSFSHLSNSTRIIPACAGTTCAPLFPFILPWDHPRVCGYNYKTKSMKCLKMGSSPRVRVQHSVFAVIVYILRIIPACAGTTIVC